MKLGPIESLLTWATNSPDADIRVTGEKVRAALKEAKASEDADKPALYTLTKRTGKWAKAEVFAVENGELRYRGTAKYQPGATRGHDWECRAIGHPDATDGRWPVVEISADELA